MLARPVAGPIAGATRPPARPVKPRLRWRLGGIRHAQRRSAPLRRFEQHVRSFPGDTTVPPVGVSVRQAARNRAIVSATPTASGAAWSGPIACSSACDSSWAGNGSAVSSHEIRPALAGAAASIAATTSLISARAPGKFATTAPAEQPAARTKARATSGA